MKFYPPDQLPPMRRRSPDEGVGPDAPPPVRCRRRQLVIVAIYAVVGLLVAAEGLWWTDSVVWVCAPFVAGAVAVGLHHATTRYWVVTGSAGRGQGPMLW